MVNNLIHTAGLSFISFIAGIATGYFLRGFIDKNLVKTAKDYRAVILMAVTFIWVISVLYEIINPAYHTSPMVHGLMGGIVGFFFKNHDK